MFNLQVSPHNSLRSPEKLRAGTRQIAVKLIASYQRYLSPLKGYHCAHRQLHGGLSCSEYVKQTIASQGIRRSIPLCLDRFRACRSALDTLKQHLKQQMMLKALAADDREASHRITSHWVTSHWVTSHRATPNTGTSDTGTPDIPDPDPPAETITQGEYYPDPDFTPPQLPPPNPLASCCLCGAVDVCCGGPVSAGSMGCGDPLAGCSCCWGGCNLEAISCCL